MKLNTPFSPDGHRGMVDADGCGLLDFWDIRILDEVIRRVNAHDGLVVACKALRLAALHMRGEIVVTGTVTALTLEEMFEADDLGKAAIAAAEVTV